MQKIYDIFKNELELIQFTNHAEHEYGSFSKVYFINDTLCIKETTDQAYLLFVDLALKNQHDKHFIEIYDHIIINDIHYILMERLQKDYSEEFIKMDVEAEAAGYWEKDSALWKNISTSLDETLEILDFWFDKFSKEHNIMYDLRFTNILKRSDNTMVIVDPWCTQ